jgi:type IV pilus assembly protein PilY1
MVFLGTGKYLETSDDQLSNNDPVQSVYGFIERFEPTPSVIKPAHLVAQTVLTDQASGRGTKARLISQNPVHYFAGTGLPADPSQDGYLGWKLNLPRGERVIYQPVSRSGVIAVASTKPAIDACESGGSSWLMALDAHNGGRLNYQAFDRNGDGIINNADSISYGGASLFTSGFQDVSLGMTSKPTVLHDQQSNTDHIAVSGSSGKLGILKLQGSHSAVGLRAWRRLR